MLNRRGAPFLCVYNEPNANAGSFVLKYRFDDGNLKRGEKYMITSTGSSQVKHVMALLSRAKARREVGEYVVEGTRMVSEIPRGDIVKVYMSESYAKSFAGQNGEASDFASAEVETVSDAVFNHMSDTKTPQGIMAVVKMKKYEFENLFTKLNQDLILQKSGSPLLICAENLQDPGNLGTIIRMSEAAGVNGVIISSNSADIYNPKVIRSTMGSIFRVPFIYTDDFIGTLDELKKRQVTLYAAHLGGVADYTDMDYTAPCAFIIGNEGNGLTDAAAAMADHLVRIPMHGQVESLNAAIACTVLAFEADRQRR
jgi:TrmH family RNA methyltransferase